MKTIGRIIHHKKSAFTIKDADGRDVYSEISDGNWWTWKYDSNGAIMKWKNSYGFGN